jgi:hypothetical protein
VKKLIVLVIAVMVISTGCRITRARVLELVDKYRVAKVTVGALCTDGVLSPETCATLADKNADVETAYRIALKADSTRADMKAAINELKDYIDTERAAQ